MIQAARSCSVWTCFELFYWVCTALPRAISNDVNEWHRSQSIFLDGFSFLFKRGEKGCLQVSRYRFMDILWQIVGLSNICYTVLDEIMECIFWRFPSKWPHWEAVIIAIIISFELSAEIFKREETMRGIKAFVILAMTAFYFPILSWGKGTNLFVLDAQFL